MMLDVAIRVRKEDLNSVVGSVFSTMLGLEVCPSDAPCPDLADLLTAAVYLTGEWEGAIRIHCSQGQACEFAGRFLGRATPTAIDDDVRDVMGELSNMIAGNLKCTFCPGIRVSMPSVTDGNGYSLRVCGGHTICLSAFQTAGGPLWVTLIDTLGRRVRSVR